MTKVMTTKIERKITKKGRCIETLTMSKKETRKGSIRKKRKGKKTAR